MEIQDSQYNNHKDVWELMLKLKKFSFSILQIQVHIQQVHQSPIVEHGLLIPYSQEKL